MISSGFFFALGIGCLLGIVLCFIGDGKVQYEIIWEDDDELLIDPLYYPQLVKDTNEE